MSIFLKNFVYRSVITFCVCLAFSAAQSSFANDEAGIRPLAEGQTESAPPLNYAKSQLINFPARQKLADNGVTFGLHYTGEVLGVLSGGIKRGADYDGLVALDVTLDLDKLVGWHGGTFFASVYNIHGRGPNENYVGALDDVSNINAPNTTRLYEFWLEQKLVNDHLTLRIGQLGVDNLFFCPDDSAVLINSAFGALPTVALNLDRSPIYPIASPAVMLRLDATPSIYLQAEIFSENRGVNHYGTQFNFNGGTLSIVEAGYQIGKSANSHLLPGIYSVGGFYNSSAFPDVRGGRDHYADYGFYLIADQMLYRPDAKNPEKGLAVCLKFSAVPKDRNIARWFCEADLHYVGLIPGRDEDVLCAGMNYTRVDDGTPGASSHYENILEITYQIAATKWMKIQPDVQYIFNPGGTGDTADALVAGLRWNVTF